MKRFLAAITFAIALTGFVGVPMAAAQTTSATQGSANSIIPGLGNSGANSILSGASNNATGLGSNAAAQPADFNLKMSDGMNSVMTWIASLFAWLVGIATLFLDYSAYYTVVTMGSFVHNLGAIDLTWSILRDIGNILLIFGFLIAGISVILDLNLYGWSKKMIPMLLVAAVFLNFSLFISEAVIDVGNLFATEFYIQINGGQMPALNSGASSSISDAIMSNLGLQTIYGEARTDPKLLGHSFLIGFSSIILFIMIAFVMFALAGILVARFVSLIYYIIISPLGFAGMAVPALNSLSKSWWSGIVKQTITAPILFLLLYIALRIITASSFLSGLGLTSANASGAATGFVNNTNLVGYGGFLLSFVVAIGLLASVIVVAQKLGAHGTTLATRAAGRLSFGTVSMASRATLGGLGTALSSRRMQAWATNPDGSPRYGRRAITSAGKYLSNRTYDLRNVGAVSKGFNAARIDAGKAASMSAREAIVDKQLGTKAVKKWFEEGDKEHKEAREYVDLKQAQTGLKQAQAGIEQAETDLKAGKIDQATHDKVVQQHRETITQHENTVKNTVSKASPQHLTTLAKDKGGEMVASFLTPHQFEKLMQSSDEEVSKKQKEKLRDERFRNLTSALKKAEEAGASEEDKAAARTEIEKIEGAEVPYLTAEVATNNIFVKNANTAQFAAAMNNKNFTEGTTEEIAKKRFAPVIQAVTDGNTEALRKALKDVPEDEVQYIDKGTVRNPVFARTATEGQAEALQKKGILNAADARKFKDDREKRFDADTVTPTGVAQEIAALKWNAKKINEQVPKETFTKPEVLNALDSDGLINLVGLTANDKLDLPAKQMQQLKAYIQNVPEDDPRAAELAAYFGQVKDHRKAIFGENA